MFIDGSSSRWWPATVDRGWPPSAGKAACRRADPRAETADVAATSTSPPMRNCGRCSTTAITRAGWRIRGSPAGRRSRPGARPATSTLPVPPGTEVRDAVTGDLLGEVLKAGDSILVAQGGRGGLGNAHFATPTRQTPHHYQPGEDGEKRTHRAHPEADRRRGPAGGAQRGQEHAPGGGDRGPAQDRGLPVHDPRAQPGRRAAQRSPEPASSPTSRASSRARTRARAWA